MFNSGKYSRINEAKKLGFSKYADSLSLTLQAGIDFLTQKNFVINALFGFIMSRLWGLIGSMQLIVMMPLMSVNIPGNVQLLYYFINYNMNFQIIPMDL
jgi:hypothetical protein